MIAATVCVAAASALSLVPAEAAPPVKAFTASISTSTAKADVGKTFTLTGTIGGTGAGKKTVIIERKVGSADWKKLTTVKTTAKGTFSKKITVKSVGRKKYRVVAPRSASRATGRSAPAIVTGYAWLDLYDQSYLSDGVVIRGWDGDLNGRTAPAHTFALSGDSLLYWNTQELCDAMSGGLELRNDGTPTQTVKVEAGATSSDVNVGAGTSVPLPSSLVDAFGIRVQRTNGSGYLALTTPKAHCSVTALPLASD